MTSWPRFAAVGLTALAITLPVATGAVATGALSVGAAVPAAEDDSPPVWCNIAGRGVSTFARTNLAEELYFQETRTDYRFRLVQYNTAVVDPAAGADPLPTPAQAFRMCVEGEDLAGNAVSDEYGQMQADVLFEPIGFVRPAWTASAVANPDVSYLIYRSPAPPGTLPANMHFYLPQEYRAWYAKGVLAGLETTTDKVGLLMNFDGPVGPETGAPPQDANNANSFLLGARSVNPDVEVVTMAQQTYGETFPSNEWPGFDSNAPWTIPTYLDCQDQALTPAGLLTGAQVFDPAFNPDATTNPVTGRRRTGVPTDCLAIDRLLAAHPDIDVVASMKASYFPQEYLLDTSGIANPPKFIESDMSMHMTPGDLEANLGDERVLTVSAFDFQAFLNQVADRVLSGEILGDPVQQVLPQRIPGYSTRTSGVDLAPVSSLVSGSSRGQLTARTSNYLMGSQDPLCTALARDYLGPAGAGYTIDAGGCVLESERYAGIVRPGLPNASPLAPEFAAHLRCLPVAVADPARYPFACA